MTASWPRPPLARWGEGEVEGWVTHPEGRAQHNSAQHNCVCVSRVEDVVQVLHPFVCFWGFFCVCITVNHQQRGEKQRRAGFLQRVLIKSCTFCQIWRTNRRRRRRRSFFSQSTQVVLFFGVYFSTSTLRAPPPPPPLPPHKESPGGIIINNRQKKSMTATILSFFFLFSFYRCRRFT